MSGGPPISLACFGLFGTAAQDDGMLERAFAEACATQGIVPGTADYAHHMVAVHQTLGEPPVDVFRADGNVQECDSPVWDETRPVRPI